MNIRYDDNLPKRITMRAIVLIELRAGKPVYTNDRDIYNEIKRTHPEISKNLHLTETK